MSSIYLVSDPRMTAHWPVPPPPGQEQHRQLDPPCERPERIIRIMERMYQLEQSLTRLRRHHVVTQNAGTKNFGQDPPFVRSDCRPVSRETVTLLHPGEYYDKLRATSSLSDAELHAMTLATLADDDVYYHQDTFTAATLACGGVVECVDAVLGDDGIRTTTGTTASAVADKTPKNQGYVSTDDEEQGNESPRDVASFSEAENASGHNSANNSQVIEQEQASTNRALAVVRPPGHHACQQRSMGFCFLNSVAVAAKHALTKHSAKCKRVVILDWDVHHGNGTQDLTYDDPNILYISLHRIAKQGSKFYFFPGTGRHDEVGHGDAEGANLNVAWDVKGVGNVEYAAAFSELILPLISAFDPDLFMISCGFDAAEGDLIGDCLLSPEMYYRMTRSLLATIGADAPMVVALEGGYNLDVITNCAEGVALALLDEPWDRRMEVASVAEATDEASAEVPITMSISEESPSKLPPREEIFHPDVEKDLSMRSVGADGQDPSVFDSFNASTIMESVRHIIDEDSDGNEGAGDDSSSAGSFDKNSSHRHLKGIKGDDPSSIRGFSSLPSPTTALPPPTPDQRLRAGRMELCSLWNFESPSVRMKGMGAKKGAVRNINQSIRALRGTNRWKDVLQLKEVANQNGAAPVMRTRGRRGKFNMDEMNTSLMSL